MGHHHLRVLDSHAHKTRVSHTETGHGQMGGWWNTKAGQLIMAEARERGGGAGSYAVGEDVGATPLAGSDIDEEEEDNDEEAGLGRRRRHHHGRTSTAAGDNDTDAGSVGSDDGEASGVDGGSMRNGGASQHVCDEAGLTSTAGPGEQAMSGKQKRQLAAKIRERRRDRFHMVHRGHLVYCFAVGIPMINRKWRLRKTYSEFLDLHRKLKSLFMHAAPSFPRQPRWLRHVLEPSCEERDRLARQLRSYLVQALELPRANDCVHLREFLELSAVSFDPRLGWKGKEGHMQVRVVPLMIVNTVAMEALWLVLLLSLLLALESAPCHSHRLLHHLIPQLLPASPADVQYGSLPRWPPVRSCVVTAVLVRAQARLSRCLR